jgi:hypothetical protein
MCESESRSQDLTFHVVLKDLSLFLFLFLPLIRASGDKNIEFVEENHLERVKGIEPSSQAWEAHILPLNHTRCRLGKL